MRRMEDPQQLEQTKRIAKVSLVSVALIQVMLLLFYYFKEQQTILAFPMLLSILLTVHAIVLTWKFLR